MMSDFDNENSTPETEVSLAGMSCLDPEPERKTSPPPSEKIKAKLKRTQAFGDKRPSVVLTAKKDAPVLPQMSAFAATMAQAEWFAKDSRLAVATEDPSGFKLLFPDPDSLREQMEIRLRIVQKKKSTKKDEEGNALKDDDGNDVTEMTEEPVSVPPHLLKQILASTTIKNAVRQIRSVENVRLPVVRDGGLRLLDEGYDTEAKVYTTSTVTYSTTMSLGRARKVLNGFFGEFTYVNDRSKSVLISLAVSEFNRMLLPPMVLRPIIFTNANKPGAGKTFGLQMGVGAVHGFVPFDTFEPDPVELKKKLAATFKAGNRLIGLDNADGVINQRPLLALASLPVYKDRILGASEEGIWVHEAQVMISGNRAKLGHDMVRRALICDLRQNHARPEGIKKKRPFSASMLAKYRPLLLAALYALTRNWVDKEMPKGQHHSTFSEWAEIIGGIMEAAGYPSPCQAAQDSSHDIEHGSILELLKSLVTGASIDKPADRLERGIHPKDIRQIILKEELFGEQLAVCKPTEQAQASLVGKLLQGWIDVPCGDLTLRCNNRLGRERRLWVEDASAEEDKGNFDPKKIKEAAP